MLPSFFSGLLTKTALSFATSWIDGLVKDKKNTLTLSDGHFLKGLLDERSKELIRLTLLEGIDGIFKELRSEALKTENELDDLKVEAIESAIRAAIEMTLG